MVNLLCYHDRPGRGRVGACRPFGETGDGSSSTESRPWPTGAGRFHRAAEPGAEGSTAKGRRTCTSGVEGAESPLGAGRGRRARDDLPRKFRRTTGGLGELSRPFGSFPLGCESGPLERSGGARERRGPRNAFPTGSPIGPPGRSEGGDGGPLGVEGMGPRSRRQCRRLGSWTRLVRSTGR